MFKPVAKGGEQRASETKHLETAEVWVGDTFGRSDSKARGRPRELDQAGT